MYASQDHYIWLNQDIISLLFFIPRLNPGLTRLVNVFFSPVNDDVQVPAGTKHYDFSFILPQDIPSSFNGTYGDIFYTLKAVVDRPWKFDYEHEVNFNVFASINLNTLPSIRVCIN